MPLLYCVANQRSIFHCAICLSTVWCRSDRYTNRENMNASSGDMRCSLTGEKERTDGHVINSQSHRVETASAPSCDRLSPHSTTRLGRMLRDAGDEFDRERGGRTPALSRVWRVVSGWRVVGRPARGWRFLVSQPCRLVRRLAVWLWIQVRQSLTVQLILRHR